MPVLPIRVQHARLHFSNDKSQYKSYFCVSKLMTRARHSAFACCLPGYFTDKFERNLSLMAFHVTVITCLRVLRSSLGISSSSDLPKRQWQLSARRSYSPYFIARILIILNCKINPARDLKNEYQRDFFCLRAKSMATWMLALVRACDLTANYM